MVRINPATFSRASWMVARATLSSKTGSKNIMVGEAIPKSLPRSPVWPVSAQPALAMASLWIGAVTSASQRPSRQSSAAALIDFTAS